MVSVYCDCGELMEQSETEDSRQEWVETLYECPSCGKEKTHTRVFDQNGLVISDEVE